MPRGQLATRVHHLVEVLAGLMQPAGEGLLEDGDLVVGQERREAGELGLALRAAALLGPALLAVQWSSKRRARPRGWM